MSTAVGVPKPVVYQHPVQHGTVVSLEFDDGVADQYQTLAMLKAHRMVATYYINSGVVGVSGCSKSEAGATCSHMSWQDLHNLAIAGNEIGGHTVAHVNLPYLPASEQQREVCNDRVNLMNQGFTVTDFAYPYGSYSTQTEPIVKSCGYNSARDVKGIAFPSQECSGCAHAELFAPPNQYATRTAQNAKASISLKANEGYVTQAEQHGGGWVQIFFHHVCNGCDPYAITPGDFSSLLDWLAAQARHGVSVQTVRDVIGGPVAPVVGGPAPSRPGSGLVQNPSFEKVSASGVPACFELGQYGTKKASFTRVKNGPPSDAGAYAEQLTVSEYVSGDAKMLTAWDLGQCSPQLSPGTRYRLSAWYKSSAKPVFVVFARNFLGGYAYWTQSPQLPASPQWRQVEFTTPPLPSKDTGLSFGLGLISNGTLTIDDYAMSGDQAPTLSPP